VNYLICLFHNINDLPVVISNQHTMTQSYNASKFRMICLLIVNSLHNLHTITFELDLFVLHIHLSQPTHCFLHSHCLRFRYVQCTIKSFRVSMHKLSLIVTKTCCNTIDIIIHITNTNNITF
jgi:hypothetical protein